MYSDKFLKRFWKYVLVGTENECWLWIGYKNKNGYGRIKLEKQRKNISSHVVSLELKLGRKLKLLSLHVCDNPACVNPNHLYEGTNQDNVNDMMDRKRWRSGNQSGENNGHATLDKNNVSEIIQMINLGLNNKQIARCFNVTHQMISRIRLKKNWNEFTNSLGYTKIVKWNLPGLAPQTVLKTVAPQG